MTETIFLEKTTEAKRNLRKLQEKLNVKIKVVGRSREHLSSLMMK